MTSKSFHEDQSHTVSLGHICTVIFLMNRKGARDFRNCVLKKQGLRTVKNWSQTTYKINPESYCSPFDQFEDELWHTTWGQDLGINKRAHIRVK